MKKELNEVDWEEKLTNIDNVDEASVLEEDRSDPFKGLPKSSVKSKSERLKKNQTNSRDPANLTTPKIERTRYEYGACINRFLLKVTLLVCGMLIITQTE